MKLTVPGLQSHERDHDARKKIHCRLGFCGDCHQCIGSSRTGLRCKYLFQWPPGGNPPPSAGGPCSGSMAMVCETNAESGFSNDPQMRRRYGWRWANCYVYTLEGDAYFARGECAGGPPAGGTQIAVLPDGRCCWIVGDFDVTPVPQLFQIWNCEDPCLTGPPEEN